MYFVRKTQATQENRGARFAADLIAELERGGISVYRVDGDDELPMVGALYTANSEKPRGFYYFIISEADITAFHVEVKPETEDQGTLFRYLRDRHFEIKAIPDVAGFATHIAREEPLSVGKQDIIALARAERVAGMVTTQAEWERAKPWTQ